MKVAVVYNRVSKRVINLFGMPNREKYGLKNIKRITDALKAGGHQVAAFEGDKDLIDRLEDFMPRVVSGERPGLVFNISYGIQGQARYTHVPGMLEMVGIPYVGSGPLAHSLALDKVVAKMIFRQKGLPTPDFAVLDSLDDAIPELSYPLIVKPKNEAVSFGIKVVNDEAELRAAAQVILDTFDQPVLVEQYIAGREVNVGLLGNNPPEALNPVELIFGAGQQIYTVEDKKGTSGREVGSVCPAPIGEELTARVQDLAKRAFSALGCSDCGRVDFRIDAAGEPYILEINSLPSLGRRGSYVIAAEEAKMDFPALVNRLVEVASARYFGTPSPPQISAKETDPGRQVFNFLTARRDRLERRVREWTMISSRTGDPVGLREAAHEIGQRLEEFGLTLVPDLVGEQSVWTYQTKAGLEGGTLLIAHLDVPLSSWDAVNVFRRDPEMLFGEGIASSRAPLAMLEFALRAVKSTRRLARLPLGVLVYSDEGQDCRYSAEVIQRAAARAARVLVLRPGTPPDHLILQRRGLRNDRFVVEGKARRIGQPTQKPEVFRWFCRKVEEMSALTDRKRRLAVSVEDAKTVSFPLLLPHRVEARIQTSYLEAAVADEAEERLRALLGKGEPRWTLHRVSDRPPMPKRKRLFEEIQQVAAAWEIPLSEESSTAPSVAGLVPKETLVACGLGPVGENLSTPTESIHRISLVERTLLLAEFLVREGAS